jgi:hypothetical protein
MHHLVFEILFSHLLEQEAAHVVATSECAPTTEEEQETEEGTNGICNICDSLEIVLLK